MVLILSNLLLLKIKKFKCLNISMPLVFFGVKDLFLFNNYQKFFITDLQVVLEINTAFTSFNSALVACSSRVYVPTACVELQVYINLQNNNHRLMENSQKTTNIAEKKFCGLIVCNNFLRRKSDRKPSECDQNY